MNLELTAAERELLATMLDEAVRNLKSEIYHTDTPEYKDQLKERELLMIGLLRKLGSTGSYAP